MLNSISVVIPVYNEEKNIAEVYRKTVAVLVHLNILFEIIFIDDGSLDKTFKILKELAKEDRQLKIIRFSKNTGQIYAILEAFRRTQGEVIIVMDGDLQNNPADIPRLLEKIEEGYDLVNGWRKKRNDPIIRKLCSVFSNVIMGHITNIRLKDYGCALFAVRKGLVKRLDQFGRKAIFLKPLLLQLAQAMAEIEITHLPRQNGTSKYSLSDIIAFGADFIFNFKKASNYALLPVKIEETIGYHEDNN